MNRILEIRKSSFTFISDCLNIIIYFTFLAERKKAISQQNSTFPRQPSQQRSLHTPQQQPPVSVMRVSAQQTSVQQNCNQNGRPDRVVMRKVIPQNIQPNSQSHNPLNTVIQNVKAPTSKTVAQIDLTDEDDLNTRLLASNGAKGIQISVKTPAALNQTLQLHGNANQLKITSAPQSSKFKF